MVLPPPTAATCICAVLVSSSVSCVPSVCPVVARRSSLVARQSPRSASAFTECKSRDVAETKQRGKEVQRRERERERERGTTTAHSRLPASSGVESERGSERASEKGSQKGREGRTHRHAETVRYAPMTPRTRRGVAERRGKHQGRTRVVAAPGSLAPWWALSAWTATGLCSTAIGPSAIHHVSVSESDLTDLDRASQSD